MYRLALKKELSAIVSLTAGCVMVVLVSFPCLEPVVSQAVPSIFSVRQQITGEISFLVPPTNIVMNGALAGITGTDRGNETDLDRRSCRISRRVCQL